ncbi:MAG: helix-turn-helix transcriptional regulator [Alphaproteobacteria bacterium]
MLKKTRLERGYKVTDVVRALNISEDYVKALESGDVSRLPSEVYVIGFAKSYAHFLGIDEQTVVKSFKEVFQKPEIQEPNDKLEEKGAMPSFNLKALQDFFQMINAKQLLSILGFLLLAIVGYKVIKSGSKDTPVVEDVVLAQEKPKSQSIIQPAKTMEAPVVVEPANTQMVPPSRTAKYPFAVMDVKYVKPVAPQPTQEEKDSPDVSSGDSSTSQVSLLNLAKSSIDQNKTAE